LAAGVAELGKNSTAGAMHGLRCVLQGSDRFVGMNTSLNRIISSPPLHKQMTGKLKAHPSPRQIGVKGFKPPIYHPCRRPHRFRSATSNQSIREPKTSYKTSLSKHMRRIHRFCTALVHDLV